MKRIHFIVTGQVQGVGFRYFCQVQAVALGLTGYARNRSDGSVEIEAQGEERAIEEFEQAVRRGPRRSAIQEVAREERPALTGETSFEIG
jgi:acylphosphatase